MVISIKKSFPRPYQKYILVQNTSPLRFVTEEIRNWDQVDREIEVETQLGGVTKASPTGWGRKGVLQRHEL